MGAGGAESLVAEMVRRGPSVNWTSGIASAGGVQLDELDPSTVETFFVPVSHRSVGGVARALVATRKGINTFRPDVILAHNVGVTLVGHLSRLSLGITRRSLPLVTVFHGVAAEDYATSARIMNRCSDAVVTVSQAILDRLRTAGLRVRARVIPNAVSVPETLTREQARAALGIGEEPVALCLARLVEQKRHDVLLDAWAQVAEPAVLLLAGQGELRPQLEEQARRLGVADRVRFLGMRRDVPALLAACDVTVLSSDWEGLPISILESMSAGRPPVVTDVDGNAEAIGLEAGKLVPRRDPAALAVALDSLLSDPQARGAAGEAGRRRTRERHDPDVLMRSYEDLFRELMAEGR